jgi:LmbE family N-acetylglucosaminyl deacetylase
LPLRLLCITAHPDDESGGFAGALLQAHERGAETRVLCLTEGRAATNRGEARSNDELAEMRRNEFGQACEVLKITQGTVLDYPDGDLNRLDFHALVTMMVGEIRRFRPHVVLTFGADGGPNLHRDHTTVGLFATAAFHWAGRSFFAPEQLEAGLKLYAPQKLYYSTTAFTFSKFTEEAAVAPRVPWSLTLNIAQYQEQKRAALQLHATQGVLDRAAEVYDKFGHEEHYLLAAAREPKLMGKETGIFDGVVED